MNSIKNWFKDRYIWIQYAAKLLYEKDEIEEGDYLKLYRLCINEAVGKIEKSDQVNTDFKFGGSPRKKLRLKSISNIQDINALAPKKPLEFGDGNLAIVYGKNGSGKSGYVRVLKHVCGARQTGKLLPNVFKKKLNVEQSCDIVVEQEGKKETIHWKKSEGIVDKLAHIDIYDINSGRIYINEENEVSYEPPVLEFFSSMVNVADSLSGKIEIKINEKVSSIPKIPTDFEETYLGKWFSNISHETKDKTLESNTEWSEDNTKDLQELNQRLTTESPADKARKLLGKKQNLDEFVRKTIFHIKQLSDDEYGNILELDRKARSKEQAAKVAGEKLFKSVPLNGVGTPVWEQLWETARKYSEQIAYKDEIFPFIEDEARCVLCQQTLRKNAKERLQSFEEYVKGELKKEAKKKRNEYEQALENLNGIWNEEFLKTKFESLEIDDEDTILKILNLYKGLRKRKKQIQNIEGEEKKELTPILDSWGLLKEARKQSLLLFKQIKKYQKDAKDDNRERLKNELKELQTRKWLSEQKEAIKKEIKRKRELYILNQAKRMTNPIGLSKKKGALAKELITDAFIKRFNNELTKLNATNINVELKKTKVTKGRVLHQIRLKNTNQVLPKDILSEGENRVITLAAFLADVTANKTSFPFIFDDPISSLDEDFEEAVVNRLVNLSKHRQVVVFTHRLSFLSLLQDACKTEKIDPSLVCVQWEPWGTGNPAELPVLDQKPKSAVNVLLNEKLKRAAKIYYDRGISSYDPLAQDICSKIRKVLERIVEDELLNDIVHRYRRAVITKGKLNRLASIKIEDCRFIEDMMSKYSKYEHSQPRDTPVELPKPDELEKDLISLRDWLKEFKKRN